jgi:WD40 repeat protein
MNDNIYEIEASTFTVNRKITYNGYSPSFFTKIDLSSCGKYLASGAKNGDVYVWELENFEKAPLQFIGHRNETTCVSWSKDFSVKT